MTPSSDTLSTTFAALADPTRRAILAQLAGGESTVTELATPFDMSMPAITKHLKVLERAGLISRTRDAQKRPCKLEAAPLQQASDFLAQYREFWEQSFDRLEAYLDELQKKEREKLEATQPSQHAPKAHTKKPKATGKKHRKTEKTR